MEQPEQDEYHKLYEQLKQIDYTLVEHSIRTDLYDQEMDRSCKEAFLNLIFHKVPAAHNRYWDSENIDSYYDCLYDIGAYIEDDFWKQWFRRQSTGILTLMGMVCRN